MSLLGFKKQFAGLVATGLKRQTIRAKRKNGRNPYPGDCLYLYTGLRTKQCRKLGEAFCASVQEITIDRHGINISGKWLNSIEREGMAKADGFHSFQEMTAFFEKEHGFGNDGFSGLLIKW